MLVYSMAAVGGVIITGQLVSRALFLGSLPAADIPYKFILPPLGLMAAAAVYARVTPHLRRDRLILATSGLLLVGALAFRALLQTAHRGEFAVLCGLFVFFDVAGDLVILQFWTFAHDLFNPREAKRLFGLIAGGSTVANVLFGAFYGTIARSVDPRDLIFLMAASLLVCMACVGMLGRRCGGLLAPTRSEPRPGDAAPTLRADAGELWRRPLLRTMAAVLVVMALASSVADYQLDLGLKATYGGGSREMLGFLGRFRFWSGIAAGVLQFFLAGRLLERFGVGSALLLLPVGMALGSGAILVTGGVLWAAAMPRACDVVLKYTVNDAAFNLLYLPTPPRLRARAKALLDGFVRPPLVSLLGVAFLVVGQHPAIGRVAWSWPLLGLVGGWILLVLAGSRQYVEALTRAVQLRRLDPDRETVDLTDEGAVRVLRRTLGSPDPLLVIHALELLPRLPGVDWTAPVSGLLAHPEAQVRRLALVHLGRHVARSESERVKETLADPDESVRAAALECLCALQGPEAIPAVSAVRRDPAPAVRAAAALGLRRHAGPDGRQLAADTLRELLHSDQTEARLAGARALTALGPEEAAEPLAALLVDPSPQVRAAAVRAAGQVRSPLLVPHLVRLLSEPAVRWTATEALSACLEAEPETVDAVLADRACAVAVRRQVVRAVGRRHSDGRVQRLVRALEAPEPSVRAAAAEALLELRRVGHPIALDSEALHRWLRAEAETAHRLRLARHTLDPPAAEALLAEALDRRVQQARDHVLSLLGLLCPGLSVASLRAALAHPTPRQQATALELIDNVAERKARELVLPLYAGSDEAQRQAARTHLGLQPRPAEAELATLARQTDPWLRSCALAAAAGRRLPGLEKLAGPGLSDDHPLLRETAARALRRTEADVAAPEGGCYMALSTLEKVLFLKGVSLFAEIPGEDIVGIVPIVREVEFAAGQTFITQGAEGDCLYILVEGEVGVQVEGRARPSLRPREVIGELAVLSEQPRTADCTALTDVVALRIGKEDFWEILREQPQIAVPVIRRIVERYL